MNFDARNTKTVSYNVLNLPRNVSASGFNMDYTYDSDGNKLNKNNGTVSTDYIDGLQYDNGTLSFVQTEEGRAIPAGGSYNYEYNLSDHLGNTRVTFDTQSGIANMVQQDDYYPFGMDISRPPITSPQNYYLYNKKELQAETGQYDYGARFYDPVIGRWTSVDPLAEKYRRWSPYNYGVDNPIRFIDPDGMLINDITAKQDGSLEVKLTDDKFDRFYVEQKDGSTEKVAQLDKHKSADGTTDLVDFPAQGDGFSRYGQVDPGGDHSVQPLVAAALFGAVNEITTNDPSIKPSFGDMSAESGAKPGEVHNGGSLSHLDGKNVDVRLISTDNANAGTTVNSPTFDKDRNQTAANAYNKFGFKDILSQTNSKGQITNHTRNDPHKGHFDHFHLQGFNPKVKYVK